VFEASGTVKQLLTSDWECETIMDIDESQTIFISLQNTRDPDDAFVLQKLDGISQSRLLKSVGYATVLDHPSASKPRHIIKAYESEEDLAANKYTLYKLWPLLSDCIILRNLEEVMDLPPFFDVFSEEAKLRRLFLHLFRDMASVLQYMHSDNIVHCNISPNHILFCYGEESESTEPVLRAKILSFYYVCKVGSKTDVSDLGFHPPPECRLAEPCRVACNRDMWSLGMTVVELAVIYAEDDWNPHRERFASSTTKSEIADALEMTRQYFASCLDVFHIVQHLVCCYWKRWTAAQLLEKVNKMEL